MKTSAFLFDMDGTLSDTEILWIPTMVEFMRRKGYEVGLDRATQVVCGRAWSSIYADITADYPALLSMSSEEMARAWDPIFEEFCAKADIRIPGSCELVERLSKIGPCCIVSGSPRAAIADIVSRLGISNDLRFYLGSEDYAHGKPSPEGFLLAASKLGIPPEECVVFEDSCAGITAARAAGMGAVALVLPGHPVQDVSAAHLQLSNLSDFSVEALEAAREKACS